MKYSKKVYKDFINNNLNKVIIIDSKEYNFKIQKGDQHKYMLSCIETGYCIEDNNYEHIKDLQKNPQSWEWRETNFN